MSEFYNLYLLIKTNFHVSIVLIIVNLLDAQARPLMLNICLVLLKLNSSKTQLRYAKSTRPLLFAKGRVLPDYAV